MSRWALRCGGKWCDISPRQANDKSGELRARVASAPGRHEFHRQSRVRIEKDPRPGAEVSEGRTWHFSPPGRGRTVVCQVAVAGWDRNPTVQATLAFTRRAFLSVCVLWEHHAQPYGGTHAPACSFGV